MHALLAFLLSFGALFYPGTPDEDGRVLTSLWNRYDVAAQADQPVTQCKILEEIKEKAVEKHYIVDFYDAATLYVDVSSSRNWKERNGLLEKLKVEISDFGEPFLEYLRMIRYDYPGKDVLWQYVSANADAIAKHRTSALWATNRHIDKNLEYFVGDDYEYVLWDMLASYSSYFSNSKDGAYAALVAKLGGSYPLAAYLEYLAAVLKIGAEKERDAAVEGHAAKYADKAVGLFSRQYLLRGKFYNLSRSKESTEQDYKDLNAECRAFENARAKFKGDEARVAKCCTGIEALLENLNDSDISVQVAKEEAKVFFKNLKSADLVVTSGKTTLHTAKLTNPKCSFYVRDSVIVKLPALDDGKYTVKVSSGEDSDSREYVQYRLSIAVKEDADGIFIYVADRKTGEPIDRVTLFLNKNDKTVETEKLSLNGFTLLPNKIRKQITSNKRTYFTLTAEAFDSDGRALRSYPLTVNYNDIVRIYEAQEEYEADEEKGIRANIYKDQGAYRPGDTLSFKAIVFKGSVADKIQVVSGRKVEAVFFDSEYNEVARLKGKTNAFGSFSGSFPIPTDRRGGTWSLRIVSKDDILANDYFTVDEFQLPTYTLTFDKREELYLSGDDITVSGSLKSYSGHPLSGASLSAKVKRYGVEVLDAKPEIGDDGSFSFSFHAADYGYYFVEVMVLDATGETLAFQTGVFVTSSIYLEMEVANKIEGSFQKKSDNPGNNYRWYRSGVSPIIVEDTQLRFTPMAKNSNGTTVPMDVEWTILDDKGRKVLSGKAYSGKAASTDISSLKAGIYKVKLSVSVKGEVTDSEVCSILKLDKDSSALPEGLRYVFLPGNGVISEGRGISFRLGTSDDDLWAAVALYGEKEKSLRQTLVHIEKGMKTIELPYAANYPDAVQLQVFFFKDGGQFNKEKEYTREFDRLSMPLEFTSFRDMMKPGTEYTFTLKTAAGVEALAAVYDKSLDAISSNYWEVINPPVYHSQAPFVRAVCGSVSEYNEYNIYQPIYYTTRAYAAGSADIHYKSADLVEEAMVMEDSMAQNATAESIEEEEADDLTEDVQLRETFSTSLTFQPHLTSDASGNISFSFRTSDKLSTYYVSVYVHDKNMRNALVRKEALVSIPVKVAVVQPALLRAGDSYDLRATVSSISEETVNGSLVMYLYPGKDYENLKPIWIKKVPVEIPAKGVVPVSLNVEVPADVEELGVKLAFVGDGFSDGLFVSIPVDVASQTLTETHSAVYHPGENKAALENRLRGEFVNVPGKDAEYSEISLLDMVKAAIPSKADPAGDNVLSLSEAWYVRLIATRLGADFSDSKVSTSEILDKIMACRNEDGGFGWFEGMKSSAVITAVLLERFAKLAAQGFEVPDLTSSVKFLDERQFISTVEYWCGGLSDRQYMYVRSMYASVPFEVNPEGKEQKQIMTDFKKNAKKYLVPSGDRGLQGQILEKARRIRTIENLSGSKEGIALAKKWGVTISTKTKLAKSLKADIESLLQYAVEHRDGGWYYPNAVMPWRGLLDSEAYAHALICNILSGYEDTEGPNVADGIRIWLMLQKESQKWGSDAAFVDAISAVLDGSDQVLGTSVICLTATYTKPYAEIKAAGNGFTIERSFYRVGQDGKSQEIAPGETVTVGERIIARYKVWNQENRSFVTLLAAREASLRPEDQLSGHYGWWRLRYYGNGFGYTPQGYREVKADRTIYYFDVFPEENVVIEESFFVTQSGSFTAPVVSIESTYAPAYRANDGFRGALVSKY